MAVLTAAVCALVTACSAPAETDEKPAMPFETVAMPAQPAAPATPGQRLQPGDVALLQQTDSSGAPADAIETTVIGVAMGDASYWDRFENGDEFADQTPFFAVMQYRWLAGEVSASTIPSLEPLLGDGTTGGAVQREYFGALGADTACPFEVPRFDLDSARAPGEYIACVVYTAPVGSTLTGLAWTGISAAGMIVSDTTLNPYLENPAVWDVVPVTLQHGD